VAHFFDPHKSYANGRLNATFDFGPVRVDYFSGFDESPKAWDHYANTGEMEGQMQSINCIVPPTKPGREQSQSCLPCKWQLSCRRRSRELVNHSIPKGIIIIIIRSARLRV